MLKTMKHAPIFRVTKMGVLVDVVIVVDVTLLAMGIVQQAKNVDRKSTQKGDFFDSLLSIAERRPA